MASFGPTAQLQVVPFVCGDTVLQLLTDPTNTWGRAQGHSNTGNRLWPAAAVLAQFLCDEETARAASSEGDGSPGPLTVIELGAGLGAVGMALAREWPGAWVVLTDQPQMLPLLRHNVAACFKDFAADTASSASPPSSGPSPARSALTIRVPEVRTLVWGGDAAASLAGVPSASLGVPVTYDLVVGSDLCYDEANFPHLRASLEQLVAPGGRVVLAVHNRPAAQAFFVAPSRLRWRLSRVEECATDPVSGRSTILVYTGTDEDAAAAGEAASAFASTPATGASEFALGDVVRAHSLHATAALNGARGVVVGTRGVGPGRVAVGFPPPVGRRAIKTSNLVRAI